MPSDFTVIQPVRQRFGDSNAKDASPGAVGDLPQEQEAPFVGLSKDFPFACPNVDPSQMAILQFESLSTTAGRQNILIPTMPVPRNIIRINDFDIPGGISNAPFREEGGRFVHFWKTHSLVVPARVLKDENILHIESVEVPISG